MERAPAFLRGMVKRLAEKKARELGYSEITDDILTQFKGQMMGKMGGEAEFQETAGVMAAGNIPWTSGAKTRLETVHEVSSHMAHEVSTYAATRRGYWSV